jgi:squalene-hopene/tetraprenyl-beta-curcumene cyclase
LVLAALVASGAGAQLSPDPGFRPLSNTSLRNEVRRAINHGLEWLEKNQDTNGVWSSPEYPAITALGLTAFQLRPERLEQAAEPAPVKRGYEFLLRCVQPDGGIYRKELPSYNTSISLVALIVGGHTGRQPVILNARKFVIGLQAHFGDAAKTNSPFEGGIGYGKADKTPDLSNSSFAFEAIDLCNSFLKDKNITGLPDLDWAAARKFIQNCQNLPDYNTNSWASADPQNKGGFVYAPGRSAAGETNLPSGRVALRSYGSMSYAGLLSYIHADLKRDDPRVTAVWDWLRSNYTVDENPAMGPQGLYYYFHMMAKALTAYGADTLETRDGKSINWREQLALKLINLQHADGSWANENGRWFEKDPALVTAYSIIALDMIYNKL